MKMNSLTLISTWHRSAQTRRSSEPAPCLDGAPMDPPGGVRWKELNAAKRSRLPGPQRLVAFGAPQQIEGLCAFVNGRPKREEGYHSIPFRAVPKWVWWVLDSGLHVYSKAGY